jgi:NADH-quinone oxidoreductase subunit M
LPLKDFSARELLILAAMSLGIIMLGLYPQPVIDMVRTTVRQLVTR